MFPLVGAIS